MSNLAQGNWQAHHGGDHDVPGAQAVRRVQPGQARLGHLLRLCHSRQGGRSGICGRVHSCTLQVRVEAARAWFDVPDQLAMT